VNDVPTPPPNLVVGAARGRWRAAEDRLYPALLADPGSYQRSVAAVQALVEELRRRAADVDDLVAAEADAAGMVAAACPSGVPVAPELLVAVACGMRDRELTAEREGRRRTAAVEAARAAGEPWAVLEGPPAPAELSDGRCLLLHLASGAALQATVDRWSGAEPFGLQVTTPDGPAGAWATRDRDAWLAEHARVRGEIEAGRATGAVRTS
jgi:hypothetical protein